MKKLILLMCLLLLFTSFIINIDDILRWVIEQYRYIIYNDIVYNDINSLTQIK